MAEEEYRLILSRLKINRQPAYEPEFEFSPEYKLGSSTEQFRAKIFYSLGHIFLERNRLDSAAAYFRIATNEWNDFSEAWMDLGAALQDGNWFAEADSAFQRGLELNPKNYSGWHNYGLLLETMDRLSDARAAYRKSLEVRPDYAPSQERLRLQEEKMTGTRTPQN